MPQINRAIMSFLFTVLILLAGGCADQNSKSQFNPETGHPDGWLTSGHVDAATQYTASCAECHGSDLSGGMAQVSCSSCHVNGNPLEAADCTSCHGSPPDGASEPNRAGAHAAHIALQNLAVDCDTCHNGAGTETANHFNGVTDVILPADYSASSGVAAYNAAGTCSNVRCHGGLTTPVWSTGTIDANTDCAQCHPNNTGAHAVHVAFQNATDQCNTCHNGAGAGTANHWNDAADVAFLSTYSANSGAATRNADGTCSNVRCHGGLTTPAWGTGSIDVNAECTACHSFGTGEYNGYYSGQHSFHVSSQDIGCTSCHDTTNLGQNHFTNLQTTAFEGSAAASLNSSLNYSGSGCTPSCHGAESW